MTNLSTSIRSVLYALKRDFGSPADFYHEASDSVDLGTGLRSVSKVKYSVRRAVPLPTTIGRSSPYPKSLPGIYDQGGTLQVGDKSLIVDRRDLPATFALGVENWYVIIDSRRYEILNVAQYEPLLAYHVTLRELTGAELDRFVEVSVRTPVGTTSGGTPS